MARDLVDVPSKVVRMSWWRLSVPVLALSCGDPFVSSPFVPGGEPAPDAGDDGRPGPSPDAGVDGPAPLPNEVLGGPCLDDAQCDDGIDCTFGSCDQSLGLCRFVADDARCADDVYCNGVERCDPRVGCAPGPPTSCSDQTPCTIDHCDEATRSCVREPRDVDGDGDVDGNCQPGADCNDLDPLVASNVPELCSNQRDDDCDGAVDEGECQLPENDTCAAPLGIDAPGSYVLSPAGAALDYGAACALPGPALRELVLSIDLPEDGPRDVEIVARALFGNLALAPVAACGDAPEAGACVRGAQLSTGEAVARLHLYSPPPGPVVVYLYTDASSDIQVDVAEEPASAIATNSSCEQRLALAPGTPVDVDLAVSGDPLESECPTDRSDRYFEFTLDETSDVQLDAESLDGFGEPRVSLRTDACVALVDELRCNQRALASTRVRALPAGTYVAAVSALGPTRARMSLGVRAPTTPPPGDGCQAPPALVLNQTASIDFRDHDDDIDAGCSPGALDAARSLVLPASSDVLLVGRFSPGDVGAVSLANAACLEADVVSCLRSADELVRISGRAMPPGTYRVVTESFLGLPATVLAAVRPALAPALVPGSDDCDNALSIGEGGGFYQGNTANASPDFRASCDFATPVGAPDQLLRLTLSAPRRVVFDMRGSDFDTLLDIRRGPECPGEEVAGACAVFSGGDRSFLDLELPAGDYFVQVDGYAGATGNWFLNVFVLDP
jgi:hypothetical protein